jgi:hypothetical protein
MSKYLFIVKNKLTRTTRIVVINPTTLLILFFLEVIEATKRINKVIATKVIKNIGFCAPFKEIELASETTSDTTHNKIPTKERMEDNISVLFFIN